MLYTLELYCDFSGAMDIVCGVGQMFGVTLPENFKQPFFSRSASEFWKRWHITLGAWFRDYIYYPVSLSAPVKRLTKWGRRRLGNHALGNLILATLDEECDSFVDAIEMCERMELVEGKALPGVEALLDA